MLLPQGLACRGCPPAARAAAGTVARSTVPTSTCRSVLLRVVVRRIWAAAAQHPPAVKPSGRSIRRALHQARRAAAEASPLYRAEAAP